MSNSQIVIFLHNVVNKVLTVTHEYEIVTICHATFRPTFSIASTSATAGIMSGINGFSCRCSSTVWGVNLPWQQQMILF